MDTQKKSTNLKGYGNNTMAVKNPNQQTPPKDLAQSYCITSGDKFKRESINKKNEESSITLKQENEQLKKENQELKTKLDNLLNSSHKSSQLSASKNCRTNQFLSQMKDNDDFNEENYDIKELIKENKELKEKLKDKKLKIRSLSSIVEKQNEEKEELSKEKISVVAKLEKKSKELKEKKEAIKELKQTSSQLNKKKNQSDKDHKKKQISKRNDISEEKNEPNSYDMIIMIDSLQAKDAGWEIISSKPYESKLKKEYKLISILGGVKTGKTFLLNKISGFELPFGPNSDTDGISLKYAREKDRIIWLDSAGLNNSSRYFNENLMKRYQINKNQLIDDQDLQIQMMNDRAVTDLFIQDFLFEVSDVIIIVVGQMHLSEQKLIERLKKSVKMNKKIIIVHNFSKLESIEDVKANIKKNIQEIFDCSEIFIPNSDISQFIEKFSKNNDPIHHFVIAKDASEAGEFFNSPTIEYIKTIIDTEAKLNKFDIIKALTEFFEDKYRFYFKFTKKPQNKITLKHNKKENCLMIDSKENYEITHPLLNFLGNLTINHPYEVILENNTYICMIEISHVDLKTLDLSIEKKNTELNCLIVKGIKTMPTFEEEKQEMICGTIRNGEFKCIVPLGANYLFVKVDKKKAKYENGRLIISVDLLSEEEVICSKDNQDQSNKPSKANAKLKK